MELHEFNTFKFFRRYFEIPARIPLQWCVIRDLSALGDEFRLGVMLKGTDFYIDVAMRRFFQMLETPAVKRRCFPARRVSRKEYYEYRTEEGWTLVKPRYYIRDIYFTALFSEELIKTRVL